MGKLIGCAAALILLFVGAAACAPSPESTLVPHTPTSLPTSTPVPPTPTPLPPIEVPPTLSADAVPRISADEAILRVDQANVLFLDIRTDIQYQQSHVKGAISMPVIGGHLNEIPRDKDLILYCA